MILALFGESNAKRFAYFFAFCGALLLFVALIERSVSLVVTIIQAVSETAEYTEAFLNYAMVLGIFAFIIFLFMAGSYLMGRTDKQAKLEREEHRSEMAAIRAQLDEIQQMVGSHSDESEEGDGEVHTDD